jgi:hypothetical protein
MVQIEVLKHHIGARWRALEQARRLVNPAAGGRAHLVWGLDSDALPDLEDFMFLLIEVSFFCRHFHQSVFVKQLPQSLDFSLSRLGERCLLENETKSSRC